MLHKRHKRHGFQYLLYHYMPVILILFKPPPDAARRTTASAANVRGAPTLFGDISTFTGRLCSLERNIYVVCFGAYREHCSVE